MFPDRREILPQRHETSFLVARADLALVEERLNTNGFTSLRYENRFVQSAYLVSKKLKSPAGGYIRLRRYIDTPAVAQQKYSLSVV